QAVIADEKELIIINDRGRTIGGKLLPGPEAMTGGDIACAPIFESNGVTLVLKTGSDGYHNPISRGGTGYGASVRMRIFTSAANPKLLARNWIIGIDAFGAGQDNFCPSISAHNNGTRIRVLRFVFGFEVSLF